MRNPIISIFMPVYNGSMYLRQTIESILGQTFKDFELVCVDDSSTDDSLLILQEYAKKDLRIRIFTKDHGGTVPKSWNFVMPHLKGTFIMYTSQDDLMSADNLELLYQRHLETGADCVLPDMIRYFEGVENKTGIFGVDGDRDCILSGREAFVLSLYWRIHGFMLCRAEIYKSEKFDENSFNSDEYVARKNFLLSNKVAFCRGVFFYRQDNPNAITKQKIKSFRFSYLLTQERLLKLLLDNDFEKDVVNKFKYKMFWSIRSFCLTWIRHKVYYRSYENKIISDLLKDQFSKMDRVTILSYKERNLIKRLIILASIINYTSFLLMSKFQQTLADVKNSIFKR